MKLWHKIFLCIFFLSFLSVGIYGTSVIHKNHLENLEREMERSSSEMDLLSAAVSDSGKSLKSLNAAVIWYGNYYEEKGIYFTLYEKRKKAFSNLDGISEEVYAAMLDVQENEKMMLVQKLGEQAYFITSKTLRAFPNTVFFYIREITSLYEQKAQKVREFLIWMLSFSAVIAAASYAVAKILTRPLVRLRKNADSVNCGNYQIQCKEGSDEIGRLGAAFNAMAKAVEERELFLKEEAEKKQQFIDAMTHEMNTPLTSIQGYAQFLRSANCTGEQREMALCNIESEAKRMHAMYQKLRTLQMMQNGGVVKECILIGDVLQDVLEELSDVIGEKKLTVKKQIVCEKLETDAVLLHVLLSNLIRNSVKYSFLGHTVIVSSKETFDGNHIVSVQDFGCGIPADSLARITEPYYRVDKSRSRGSGGCGIGLYLCQEIMTQLGGTMNIHSKEGCGTTVELIFYNNDTM